MKFRENIGRLGRFLSAALLLMAPVVALADSPPVVSNVQAAQRLNSFIVDITYDLAEADGDDIWVTIYFSPDGGATWPIHCATTTGAANNFVFPGTGLGVEWNAEEDYPDFISGSCTIRVVAVDHLPWPGIQSIWKTDLDGQNGVNLAYRDTIPFGEPFRLNWEGHAPAVSGLDPGMITSLDGVFPYDDGLLGYKYDLLLQDCIPTLEDCWSPRRFNEATGDSFSYFGNITSLDFHNDGSGSDPFHELLPSGLLAFKLNTLDVAGLEIRDHLQQSELVINFDPETIMLDGETDWAHPSDPEIYPYYILLNDPLQVHYPFQSGDRIPDRTYVVVKALGRDDPRDNILDPGYQLGITGFLQGTRQNLGGGAFSFQSESSSPGIPAWAPNPDGWAADTLGFLTGPNTEFTINMQSVDEHGRQDGTPGAISFEVGFPPCVQCIEVFPKSTSLSEFDETLICLEDTSAASLEAHPCFGDTTILRVSDQGLGNEDLEFLQQAYMLVDKATGITQIVNLPGQGGEDNFEFLVNLYQMNFLLHGLDDVRERWAEKSRRMLGCAYQVDYDCDPENQIQDGIGNDDIETPTWGYFGGQSGLDIDATTGLWKFSVQVAVPRDLMAVGPVNFRDIILLYSYGITDPVLRQRVFDDTTRQFGTGRVQFIALDQTKCGFLPIRPGRYNFFRNVRPSVASPPAGMSWRDCDLIFHVPDIMMDLDISPGAMPSLEGEPVSQYFRIILETATGDFECQGP